MHVLRQLEELGQSVWYDNISRSLISSGDLERLVGEGLLGVTSNPTIFDKAISGSADYDPQIGEILSRQPEITTADLIRALMVKDIQMATDALLGVFERTAGRDGYVSVEVTPSKARNTAATIEEVRQIWSTVRRKNVMIKIPATQEGLPAITHAIGEGYNVNVTLIFSLERYREVAEAYIQGLEHRAKEGRPLGHVASVASVFVSRIDTLTDELLKQKIVQTQDGATAARLKAFLGKAAVANTKLIYQAFREIFEGPRFAALKAHGAHVQRPLWASTGTKNPAYSDLLYVETLIGPHTVNTVPPATYAALNDHLRPALTVEREVNGAHTVLRELEEAGIDMAHVMKKLEADGVAAFEKSFDGLYANLEAKKARLISGVTTGPR